MNISNLIAKVLFPVIRELINLYYQSQQDNVMAVMSVNKDEHHYQEDR